MASIIVPEMTLDEINMVVTPSMAASMWDHITSELPHVTLYEWKDELSQKDDHQVYYVERLMDRMERGNWRFVSMTDQEALLEMLNESCEEESRMAVLGNMNVLTSEGSVIGLIGPTLQSAQMLSASRRNSIPGFDCWEFHNYWPAFVILWRFLRTRKWLDVDGH